MNESAPSPAPRGGAGYSACVTQTLRSNHAIQAPRLLTRTGFTPKSVHLNLTLQILPQTTQHNSSIKSNPSNTQSTNPQTLPKPRTISTNCAHIQRLKQSSHIKVSAGHRVKTILAAKRFFVMPFLQEDYTTCNHSVVDVWCHLDFV